MNEERTPRQSLSDADFRTAMTAQESTASRSASGTTSWQTMDLKELSEASSTQQPSRSPRKSQIVAHLDQVCSSSLFATSKRCQQFLRYIVTETLEGRGDLIKERNIASDVFGKGSEFEPGEDSLVRVKAREVRKRLADFYELHPPEKIQIEVPLGGYAPRIYFSSPANTKGQDEPESSASAPPSHRVNRRRLLWMLGGAVGVAGGGALWRAMEHHTTALERLWRPVFATKTPLVIFIPILKIAESGEISDRVGIGPTAALRRAADFLTEHRYPYHLRFGADLTFAQLREQPSLLLGGFSSIWTQLMTSSLRFSLEWNSDIHEQSIVDTKTKQTWHAVNRTEAGYADQDYGLLCRLFDKQSGQIAMIAGGITTFATEGAASVFFDPGLVDELIRQAPGDWETRNFEAVIRVSVIGTTPSSPQLIATHFW